MIATGNTTTPCPKCGGDKQLEAQHPHWGSYSCPEAYIMVDCPRCDGAGVILMNEAMIYILADVEAYLDRLADYKIDANGRQIGNEAAHLLQDVQDAIKRLEGK